MKLITDAYDRKARLYPALLTIAPVIASGYVIFPWSFSDARELVLLILGAGGAFLLAQLGRDFGKEGEKHLYSLWGGMPSVAIFRHRDSRLDAITKATYHKQLAKFLKTKSPSAQNEQADPTAADEVYRAWSNHLVANTRDREKFDLLLKENIHYGYRRNVWGLRPVGIAASAISIFICAARIYFVYQSDKDLDIGAGLAGSISLVLLILWAFYFTSEWVRSTADTYAARLIESIEVLYPQKPRSNKP